MKQDYILASRICPGVSMEEESVLIKSILRGEKNKFRYLVDQNKDLIFSLIIKQVGNVADAE